MFLSRVSEHWEQYKFRDVVLPENDDLFLERSAPAAPQSPFRSVQEDCKQATPSAVNAGKTEVWKSKMLATDRQSALPDTKKGRRKGRAVLSKN